jgi:hypothetical protein
MFTIWRDSLCAPQKGAFWRDSPFTRHYILDWRDSSQSCGGERNLPSASHLGSITERRIFLNDFVMKPKLDAMRYL